MSHNSNEPRMGLIYEYPPGSPGVMEINGRPSPIPSYTWQGLNYVMVQDLVQYLPTTCPPHTKQAMRFERIFVEQFRDLVQPMFFEVSGYIDGPRVDATYIVHVMHLAELYFRMPANTPLQKAMGKLVKQLGIYDPEEANVRDKTNNVQSSGVPNGTDGEDGHSSPS